MPEAVSETSHVRSPKELTEEDKILVRETWKEAAKPEVQAGQKLFQKIFQISPDAMSYFSNPDMESDEFKAHITRVMSTLDTAIQNLDDLAELAPTLERLGTIHATMGIKKEQLAVVKEALLSTLAQELKDAFTEKCRNAWALTFDILAEAMAAGMVSS